MFRIVRGFVFCAVYISCCMRLRCLGRCGAIAVVVFSVLFVFVCFLYDGFPLFLLLSLCIISSFSHQSLACLFAN